MVAPTIGIYNFFKITILGVIAIAYNLFVELVIMILRCILFRLIPLRGFRKYLGMRVKISNSKILEWLIFRIWKLTSVQM